MSYTGKSAVITGGGSGINLAFAKLLLERGCSVLIGDLALRPEAEALLRQYPHPATSEGSPSALFQRTNVTSWPQISSLWQKAITTFPQVDIVVPGAGLFDPDWASFWHPPKTATNPDTPSRDDADGEPGHYAVLDVNLNHPIRLSQLAIGYWSQRGIRGANLVHVSSIAGHTAGLGSPIYHASKNGLTGFVRSLGELKETLGIRVSAVAPGGVLTPMWTEVPERAEMMKVGKPAFMEPEEVGRAMLELCENPEYGDGTILEVLLGKTRVVPLFHAEVPSGEGLMMPGYEAMMVDLKENLKKGLKV